MIRLNIFLDSSSLPYIGLYLKTESYMSDQSYIRKTLMCVCVSVCICTCVPSCVCMCIDSDTVQSNGQSRFGMVGQCLNGLSLCSSSFLRTV